MPKVLDILRIRWPEVALLVGLQTAVFFLGDRIMAAGLPDAPEQPIAIAFLLGFTTMSFAIVWQMLYLGFLRTAYVEGDRPYEPLQLLRVGRYYFWRIVRFGLILAAAWYALIAFGLAIAIAATAAETPRDLPIPVITAVMLAVFLAVMKPMSFSPAIIVARDVMALPSITLLREYRLFANPPIVLIYLAAALLSAAVFAVDQLYKPAGPAHYALMAANHLLVSFAFLAIHLAALRVIHAAESPPPPESEGESESEPQPKPAWDPWASDRFTRE